MKELQLRNEEVAQFEALKKQSLTIADNCSKLNVTDDPSLAVTTQNLSKLKEFIRNLEKLRKEAKEPYLKAGQQIDALAKELSSPLENVLKSGETNILAYNKIKEGEAIKEQQRILNIKADMYEYSVTARMNIDKTTNINSLDNAYETWVKQFPGESKWFEFMEEAQQMRVALRDYCSQKRIQLTAPKEADETVQEIIQETITAQLEVFGAEEIKEAEFTTTSNIKNKWVFELKNKEQLPLAWIMLDEKAVKEFIKQAPDQLEDEKIIGGVKFTIEKQLKIR